MTSYIINYRYLCSYALKNTEITFAWLQERSLDLENPNCEFCGDFMYRKTKI